MQNLELYLENLESQTFISVVSFKYKIDKYNTESLAQSEERAIWSSVALYKRQPKHGNSCFFFDALCSQTVSQHYSLIPSLSTYFAIHKLSATTQGRNPMVCGTK